MRTVWVGQVWAWTAVLAMSAPAATKHINCIHTRIAFPQCRLVTVVNYAHARAKRR